MIWLYLLKMKMGIKSNSGIPLLGIFWIETHMCKNKCVFFKKRQLLARVWKNWTLIHCWWKCKMVHFGNCQFLKTLSTKLPYTAVFTLRNLSNRLKNICLHNLYTNTHSSIVYNSHKVETTGETECGVSVQWNIIQQ